MVALYNQFLLFGDSITQDSFNPERGFGWSTALQHAYIRRLDVVNRGLSGYNTQQALKVLPSIIPPPETARIRFLVVFFGANDAAFPQPVENQHVPLDEYKLNLEKIITHPLVKAHDARILLVTPPPINEHRFWPHDKLKGRESVSRVAAVTKSYADAAFEVGNRLGVPVVHLWNAFMSKAGLDIAQWKTGDPLPGSLDVPENETLKDLMFDGLHFNRGGYEILYEETIKAIAQNWPDQLPENLEMVLPAWNDRAAWEA